MSSPLIGTIILFAGPFAPNGYAFCDGSLLPISSNPTLYAIIGITYGGNGTTTFGLPDLRGRVPIGNTTSSSTSPPYSLSTYMLGQEGGVETVTLATTQMPTHNHMVAVQDGAGSVASPSNAYLASTINRSGSSSTYVPTLSTTAQLAPLAVTTAGGSQPHTNIQPFQVLNYIIATAGTFPQRP